VLLLLVCVLLRLPPVQRTIKNVALNEVMKKTHNRLTVGDLYLRPFNRLQLREVYAGDLRGDTLLYVKEVSARFDLLRLLNKQLLITSVDLDNFTVKANKESVNGEFNFRFLIDAFASEPADTLSSPLRIAIHNIRLKKGRATCDIRSEPALPDSLFDIHHICLSDIYLKIDVRSLDRKHLDVRLRSLSFVEKSGLNVKQLQAVLKTAGDKYRMSDVRLQLAHSQLIVPKGDFDSQALHLTWADTKIYPPELKMFYPALAAFPEPLSLSGEVSGEWPKLELSRFRAEYGKHGRLRLRASISDYKHWQTAPVQLHIESLSADAWMVHQVQIPVRPGAITLTGSVQGTLPQLKWNLTAGSDRGDIRLKGFGGYDFRSKTTRFDAFVESQQFDVGALLQDTLFGLASLQLQAKGEIPAAGLPTVNANARIDRFDFKGYTYNRISANAAYRGDQVQLNVYCDDDHLPLELNACANTGNSPGLMLDARLERICLDTLHLLPGYQDAFLYAQIRMDVSGFDPENMKADLCIDSLLLTTGKGSFSEPRFNLSYAATDKGGKDLNISSEFMNVRAKGRFTYAGLLESMRENFPVLFPNRPPNRKLKDRFPESFDFRVGMNHVNNLSDLLELPQQIPDSALIMGRYNNDGQNIKLSASAYTRFLETDTLQLSLALGNRDNQLAVVFNVDNKSLKYDVDGGIDAEIEFVPKKGSRIPDMNIRLNPAVWVLNETMFDFHPAGVEIREGRYTLHDLLLDYADNPNEFIRINGVVSASEADSLTLDISQFQLSTLFGAVKTDLSLSGMVNGRAVAHGLLSSPWALVRDFEISRIVFDGNAIGDLKVNCGWNSQHNGLALDLSLGQPGQLPSTVRGFVLPGQDSIQMQATVRDIDLKWFQKELAESLFGLSGSLGAGLTVSGKLSSPAINGIVRADSARVGITSLSTLYTISDSIVLSPGLIELKQFTILDENRHTLTATGSITHNRFAGFTPNINLVLNDFLVLNNEHRVDSLFYGNLRVNGLLTVKQSLKDWLISGDITHSNNARLTVNLPTTASTAERYNRMISYVNTEPEESAPAAQRPNPQTATDAFRLPLKINASLWFDPSLTVGAVFNPVAGDAVQIKGNGMVRFTYDMSTAAMRLLGDYEISSGSVNLSLANIARKTFSVQEGGKLVFHGDPMTTTFNLTALYNLRADLQMLDPSFGNIGIVNTKVPVSCSLTATGSIDRMALEYDIMLPTEPEDIQRKMDGLLYTDDMKIKQIAYLLALGSFMPASGDSPTLGSPTLLNSLASLTSGGLNKLLAGILNDKWSLGTDLQTDNRGLNNMAINVSGMMLNDRLTINGTVGYHNSATRTNNFTGDFDIEYKLIPSGNLVLKAYNVTNNQYYEQAPTTQGVGVAYKRQARTFRKLFDKFRKKK
jgi:hypothetical protein